jgi:hypothetical protein
MATDDYDIADYDWSVTTLKLREIFEKAFAICLGFDDLVQIEDVVETCGNREGPPHLLRCLNVLASGEEHVEAISLPPGEHSIGLESILAELEHAFSFLSFCDYGEWMLWHLPGLGYGLYLQREASPRYYWTAKRLLDLSYEKARQNYSFG